MNYINGLRYSSEIGNPTGNYGQAARNFRRLLWRWLHTVIGWGDHDKTAAVWDNPVIATRTDGATDATDPWIFTSATGGFTTALINAILCVHPTDATVALTGGFTDPEQNGLFKIINVINPNTLILTKGMGVDAVAGLPLSETGLTFTIDDFYPRSDAPINPNFFVLEGQHTDTTPFHFYNLESTENYGANRSQISPYGDWDAVTHAWNASNRVSAQKLMVYEPLNSNTIEITAFAGGDKTHFWVVAVFNDIAAAFRDMMYWHVGEFDRFHASDLKPSFQIAYVNSSNLSPWSGIRYASGVNADGTVPVDLSGRNMCKTRDSAAQVQAVPGVTRTRYSGRSMFTPLILSSEVAGYEAIRGELKIMHGPSKDYVGQQPRVLGLSKQFLQIYDQVYAWNGTDIRQAFYGV